MVNNEWIFSKDKKLYCSYHTNHLIQRLTWKIANNSFLTYLCELVSSRPKQITINIMPFLYHRWSKYCIIRQMCTVNHIVYYTWDIAGSYRDFFISFIVEMFPLVQIVAKIKDSFQNKTKQNTKVKLVNIAHAWKSIPPWFVCLPWTNELF